MCAGSGAMVLLMLPTLACAHSIIQAAADSIATSSANDCVVKLVRRTSKNTPCLPDGDSRGGGHFGCDSNSTVHVSRHCAGLFQCGNGYTTMCTASGTTCKCETPCHKNQYTSHSKNTLCPPAFPPSPMLPPLPPTPPFPPPPPLCVPPPLLPPATRSTRSASDVAGCASWCNKQTDANAAFCKCAACSSMVAPLPEGAPCHHGRSPHHGDAPGATPVVEARLLPPPPPDL